MPGSRRTRHNRVPRDTNALRRHTLEQIPTPPMTVHQKFKFLEHIAKVFFFILQEFMNNQQNTDLHTGIYRISQRPSTDHFLTYEFSLTNFWRPVHKKTTTLQPASYTSWPLHPQKMKTNCYSLHSKNYVTDIHRQKDLLLPHSLNGYGTNAKNLCGDNPLTSMLYKLSFTSRS